MPLPSLWISDSSVRAWSLPRAAGYGAGIGALAALFKTLAALREAGVASSSVAGNLAAALPEIVAATLAFGLLCVAACVLRNLLARRLIWPDAR